MNPGPQRDTVNLLNTSYKTTHDILYVVGLKNPGGLKAESSGVVVLYGVSGEIFCIARL